MNLYNIQTEALFFSYNNGFGQILSIDRDYIG